MHDDTADPKLRPVLDVIERSIRSHTPEAERRASFVRTILVTKLGPQLSDDDVTRLVHEFGRGHFWLEISLQQEERKARPDEFCPALLLSLAHGRNETGRPLCFFPGIC